MARAKTVRLLLFAMLALVGLAAGIAAPSSAMELGLNSSASSYKFGVHSHFYQPATTYNSSSLPRAYFVATTLPDGVFLQAGYADTDHCSGSLVAFETILLPNRRHVADLWNYGTCGLTGAHWFAISNYSAGGGLWNWFSTNDGTQFGPVFTDTAEGFLANNGGIASELVYDGNIGTGSPYPQLATSRP